MKMVTMIMAAIPTTIMRTLEAIGLVAEISLLRSGPTLAARRLPLGKKKKKKGGGLWSEAEKRFNRMFFTQVISLSIPTD
jgi:hypothetical protein